MVAIGYPECTAKVSTCYKSAAAEMSTGSVSSPPRDSMLPASSAFYLMMSVKLNINKHNNIAPTNITTKTKEFRTNIYRFK